MINAYNTIMLTDTPNVAMARMPSRKLPGMATPTSSAARMPRMPMTTINTSSTAAMTLFCSSVSMLWTSLDLSREATIEIVSGQNLCSSATIALTSSMNC